jgi:hypothetical protein
MAVRKVNVCQHGVLQPLIVRALNLPAVQKLTTRLTVRDDKSSVGTLNSPTAFESRICPFGRLAAAGSADSVLHSVVQTEHGVHDPR